MSSGNNPAATLNGAAGATTAAATMEMLLRAAEKQQQQQQQQQSNQNQNFTASYANTLPLQQQQQLQRQIPAAFNGGGAFANFSTLPPVQQPPQANSSQINIALPDLMNLLMATTNNNNNNGIGVALPQRLPPPQQQQLQPVISSRLPVARASGSRTFPCRARGMPETHNFNTAVLTVPADAKHGQGLVCTHPTCRDGGIKFSYCLYCKMPVSKRLFRGKHKYCGPGTVPGGGKAAANKAKTTKPAAAATKSASATGGNDVDGGSKNDSSDTDSSSSRNENNKNKKRKRKAVVFVEKDEDDIADELTSKFVKASKENADPWLCLLLLRPSSSDADQMAAWMRAVLEVSDGSKRVRLET